MSEHGGARRWLVVALALGANAAIAILKLAAGLLTGSGALLSEAAHSAGDCITEVLLLVAVSRSARPADREHPFGYGKERYFWSLLAAVGIFVSGAAFSIFQGVHTIVGPEEPGSKLWVNYVVLALAAVLEAISFRTAAREMREQAHRRRQSWRDYIRDPEDPTVSSVTLEDSVALIGIVVAAAGVGLHQLTGSAIWDGAASLVIGGLLLVVAFVLARTCETLLIGKQADPRLLAALEKRLEGEDEIVDVVDLLTMVVGAGRVLLCVRADFVDTLTTKTIEQACVRVAEDLRAEVPALDEIFIQPASRDNPRVQERVRERYGRALADEGGRQRGRPPN
jgi:cation diffusion facilitator family transporter